MRDFWGAVSRSMIRHTNNTMPSQPTELRTKFQTRQIPAEKCRSGLCAIGEGDTNIVMQIELIVRCSRYSTCGV